MIKAILDRKESLANQESLETLEDLGKLYVCTKRIPILQEIEASLITGESCYFISQGRQGDMGAPGFNGDAGHPGQVGPKGLKGPLGYKVRWMLMFGMKDRAAS